MKRSKMEGNVGPSGKVEEGVKLRVGWRGGGGGWECEGKEKPGGGGESGNREGKSMERGKERMDEEGDSGGR